GPEETTGAFDHAPGLKMDTRRHDDAQKMLETERLDVGAGNRDAASSWFSLRPGFCPHREGLQAGCGAGEEKSCPRSESGRRLTSTAR
ncbi:MAG: hypothetical protein ACXVBO_15725, partial [Isosphaeraceae bacterium]